MADYCNNGTSFTVDNTWIDLWDAHGFIEKREEWDGGPMYAEESSFNASGVLCLESSRYEELPPQCIGCITLPGSTSCIDFGVFYEDRDDCHSSSPLVFVDACRDSPEACAVSAPSYSLPTCGVFGGTVAP